MRDLTMVVGNQTLAPNISRAILLDYLARASDGASGRDLKTLVEQATIHAISRARQGGNPLEFAICTDDFLMAQQ